MRIASRTKKIINASAYLALLSCVYCSNLYADQPLWQGKRAAVALTYDDSLNVHLDKVVPALNKHGLKGTFYLTVNFAPYPSRLNEWQQVAAEGHELGNHTLFHPCSGKGPGREWVNPTRDLSQWSVQRVVDNIQVGNTALQALDNQNQRTLAYPCGDTDASGESYIDAIKPMFVGARGVKPGYPKPSEVNRYDIAAHMINGQSLEQLQAMVDTAIEREGLLVFLFHGVGGEHGLNLDETTHSQLLDYLVSQEPQLWIAPMQDIAQFIAEQQPQ